MDEYAILNNRKRAIIALVHSVFFLLIAVRGAATSVAMPIWMAGTAMPSALAMMLIYLVVSSILIILVGMSGCARERLYFGFCACSASVGLLRAIFGDANLPAGRYLRVAMLLCAVATGTVIFRNHSPLPIGETED